MSKNIKAVMMAGGFGTRIQPLTNSVPKPMLSIMNLPMMEHTLNRLIETGIDDIVILLYFKPEIIKEYFQDGSKWGVKIQYVVPDDDYGTAGAVGFGREFLDTTFMIVSGDLVTDFDFREILDYHEERDSKLTITLTSVENPLQFGVVIANEDGKIEKFLEKPSWGEVFSDTINTGIYVIEPEILDYIPVGESFDFAKDLFPLLMKESVDLLGYNATGYWRDVGNPESYRDLYDDISNRRLKFQISGRKIEYPEGTLYMTGNSKVDANINIVDTVVIGDNVTVGEGSRLHNVVVGDNVTFGKGCRLRNSIFWDDISVGNSVVLDNAVICNDNKIGDSVTAKAGLILAEGCNIGKFAVFEQDVTVWPEKEIEPTAIVNNSIVLGTKYRNAIFESGSIVGKSNVEISCGMACKIAEAFGSQLPIGSCVLIGCDYDKSPRMIKRAFVGGLLSAGVDVLDLHSVPPSMLRYNIQSDENIIAGAYFRKSLSDPANIEITLYNEEGLRLDHNSAKTIEKSFFKEDFRRVNYSQIGNIYERDFYSKSEYQNYKDALESSIDGKTIKNSGFRVAVDLMFGITKDFFPQMITNLQIDNIMLNTYKDDKKLANIEHYKIKSKKDISDIVKNLGLNMGILIDPHGQSLTLVTDMGEVLNKVEALIAVLELMNMEAELNERKMHVFLPTWAPDLMDQLFKYLIIERGKYANFKSETLNEFDLIATIDGNYAFTEFALHRDAMYASLKIMELLARHKVKLSNVAKEISRFFYATYRIPCPQSLKGKIMRKFLEYAKDKKSSSIDGVKIWESETDWVLMIPDQYNEHLNLYIQALDEELGNQIYNKYSRLIGD
ncbi:sugar phosphate nucleotidyltransferase [Hydrogenimonas thermophila]|uniref:sugar phosphate nucleotidyltransferase n=1 Tax=Hydrogenimonas thermophila TaxID=223786 RepID=UPI00293748C8|nr:sugar phosphate nucleotidyltransferase [Hydrogenimonas thermophila]WOE69197.1 sugar phosphate nucleotidyltransferase [Hydrogenimonas thermophila]WOE71707.1 sugar phosphate nucleotidyltransferase [Hydrogenimonas thermophila]